MQSSGTCQGRNFRHSVVEGRKRWGGDWMWDEERFLFYFNSRDKKLEWVCRVRKRN